jgi:hypothetical protein
VGIKRQCSCLSLFVLDVGRVLYIRDTISGGRLVFGSVGRV